MKIELDSFVGVSNKIDAYNIGQVTIAGNIYQSSLLISHDTIVSDWSPQSFSELATSHLEQIIALGPEIVLLGTGKNLIFPSDSVIAPITEQNIGFEVMDTGAACRSYNFLINEGRPVVAALMMIEE
ncbi:MAG: Xcc1710-like domain-containing protein [Gammaproteobacteria bacterium]|jgi:uncharacterized protein|nr:Xcc1710-like domain-containing protein [Gammaproteobacteria bacterium]